MDREEIKNIIEVLIFASGKPLAIEEIREVIGEGTEAEMEELIGELRESYRQEGKSFHILPIAGGYQMRTVPRFGPWLQKLYRSRYRERLSKPAVETLAIIAYRQPVTRAEMEAVRGVSTGSVLHTLLERNLIRIAGRKRVPGRPLLYRTTDRFLEHFGLSSVEELPRMEELEKKAEAREGKETETLRELTQAAQGESAQKESEDGRETAEGDESVPSVEGEEEGAHQGGGGENATK